jgi:hypothetical protein
MDSILNLIPSLFLGIALSASSGMRVFVPLLVSNLASKFGWVEINETFSWMGDTSTTYILLIAASIEIGSYYISFVDNILDMLALPLSILAGTLLTTQFLEIEDPVLKWGLGLVAGGGSAGTIQAGSSVLRLASSKFTLGIGNFFMSTLENIGSIFFSVLAIFLPVFMGFIALLFLIFVFKSVSKLKKRASV